MKKGCTLGFALLLLSLLLAGCATEIEEGQQEVQDTTLETSYFEPLSALDIPDEATLVAFGEATHGNHEFKSLATEVFKKLVLEKGFRAFVLEAHFGNCAAINEYILHGTGTAKDAVSGNGFWVHSFQEVVDLVEWMREYNLTADEGDKLSFYGCDIQETDVGSKLFLEYLQTVDPKKAKEYQNAYSRILNISVYDFNAYTANQIMLRDLLDHIEQTISEMEQNKEIYILASSQSDYDFALRNAVCVRNTFENALLPKNMADLDSIRESFNHRDQCMFDNVRWIVEREESLGRGKVFLFAHNGHIRKSEYKTMYVMGQHLSAEYGDRYVAIGTNYYQNTFLAMQPGKGLSEGSLINDSGEFMQSFVHSTADIDVIDIKKNMESDEWMEKVLQSEQEMGVVGAVYDPSQPADYYTGQFVPASAYDMMILVRNATPATLFK